MSNIGQVAGQTKPQASAKDACSYCGAAEQHEGWCFTTNVAVRYAYEIVLGSKELTAGDVLILHSLGVIW